MSALDELGRKLGDAVERQAEHSVAGGLQPRRRFRTRGRRLLAVSAGMLALATALVAWQISLGGRSDDAVAATLPALRHADRDVSRLPGLPPSVRKRMDLRRAYEFSTASGAGFVVASPDREQICVVIATSDSSYRSTCARTDQVQRRGLVSGLVRPNAPPSEKTIAVVLPDGAPSPTIRYPDGRIKRLAVINGVATGTLPLGGFLRVVVRENVRTLRPGRRVPSGPPRRG